MTQEELDTLIALAESGDILAMNKLSHLYAEGGEYTASLKWFKVLVQKENDPQSGVYHNTQYNKELCDRIVIIVENALSNDSDCHLSSTPFCATSLFPKTLYVVPKQAHDCASEIRLIEKEAQEKARQENERQEQARQERARQEKEYIEKRFKFIRVFLDEPQDKTPIFSIGNIGHFSIPSGIAKIPNYTFWCCDKLETIDIPESVTIIGKGAFSYCKSLHTINIPNGVAEIEERTFQFCSKLETINIPESVKRIGNFAFAYCMSLHSINIPNSVTEIGKYAFTFCRDLESVTINQGNIGDHAFSDCRNISLIKIGDGVQQVEYSAFNYNNHPSESLKKIIVPKGTKQRFSQMEELKDYISKIVEE